MNSLWFVLAGRKLSSFSFTASLRYFVLVPGSEWRGRPLQNETDQRTRAFSNNALGKANLAASRRSLLGPAEFLKALEAWNLRTRLWARHEFWTRLWILIEGHRPTGHSFLFCICVHSVYNHPFPDIISLIDFNPIFVFMSFLWPN